MSIRTIASAAGFTAVLIIGIAVLIVLRSGGLNRAPVSASASDASGPAAATSAAVTAVGQYAEERACVRHSITFDGLPPTIDTMAKVSTSAVIGTVMSVDKPRWNTSDGAAPTDEIEMFNPVYRVVIVQVATDVKGDAASTFEVRVPGGIVGCEIYSVQGVPLELKEGDEIALFAQDLPAKDAKGARLPVATNIWPVVDGAVQTPENGVMSTDALASEMASADE